MEIETMSITQSNDTFRYFIISFAKELKYSSLIEIKVALKAE